MADGERVSATFVIRLIRHPERATGVVERVRTGERECFEGLEQIGSVIAQMLEGGLPSGEHHGPPGQ